MDSNVERTWNGADVMARARAFIGKSTWAIGMAVMSDAKQLCAVNYGYLAASIMVAGVEQSTGMESPASYSSKPGGKDVPSFVPIQKPGSEWLKLQVFVGTAVEYGPHIEYGTVRTDAQPFLRPALDMARGEAPEIVIREAKTHFAKYLYQHDAYVASRLAK